MPALFTMHLVARPLLSDGGLLERAAGDAAAIDGVPAVSAS